MRVVVKVGIACDVCVRVLERVRVHLWEMRPKHVIIMVSSVRHGDSEPIVDLESFHINLISMHDDSVVWECRVHSSLPQ